MPIDCRMQGTDVLVLVYSGQFSDADYEVALARMNDELESAKAEGRKIAMISVGTSDSGMTSRQRVRSAEWVRDHTPLLRSACVGQGVVVGGAIQRGVLTAILWMIEYPIPIKAHSSEDDAQRWVRLLFAQSAQATLDSRP